MNELHLFAGAGGGILGGMLLGHTTVCAVEIEPYCRKVLLQRQRDGILPKFPIWDDVQTFNGNPWRGKVDIICGGFPCQDISAAGKGAGIEGSRSSMWKHMARIIGEVRPKYAFVENSPMLVGRGLSTVLADLAEMGYDAKWGIVGAHHVSAPHRRDRIWIMANAMHQRDERWEQQQEGSKEAWNVADTEKLFSYVSNYNGGVSAQSQPFSKSGDGCGAENMANTNLPQCKGMRFTSGSQQEYTNIMSRCSWWRQDPAEAPKSNVGRMAHGVASRVDRLKAIGNGQVSICAAMAWRILCKMD